LSDSSHAARRRHEYMPNRMFDPAANPFAVQNLLIKEEQVFTVTTEERPEFGFESDPLVSKESAGMFALDEVIELADLTGATAFASEANADSAFVAETSSAAADMTAATQETAFMADAAMAAQSTTGFTENTEQDDTVAAIQSQDALAASTSHTDDADAGIYAETDADIEATSSVITENDLAVSDDVFVASAEAIESEAQAPELESATEQEPEPATPAVASAPATPDLSGEAVTALVEAAREQARAETRELAYNEGLEAGKAQARAELQQEHDTQITQLKTLQEALQKLSFDADALFEPVKKLTVHLAEQLVRGELAQSGQTISRLVDNSLRELNASGEKAVIVHLNHEDLEAYRPLVAQFGDSMILRPDSLLERGSVRVSLDGSVVEDLMQRRIDGLKKSLSQPAAPSWQAGGGRLSERLNESQRGSQQIEDVTAVETSSSDNDTND
jgi:flagellar biosynthesis/type III secretory pathway protein FliH